MMVTPREWQSVSSPERPGLTFSSFLLLPFLVRTRAHLADSPDKDDDLTVTLYSAPTPVKKKERTS